MRRRPERQTRLEDVAKAAGVSRSTASRVISGSGPASPTARERVHSAARLLGYRPDQAARSLVNGSGFRVTLAVVGTTAQVLDDPYVHRAVAAAALTATSYDVGVSLQWVPRDAPRLDRLLADRTVRGVVVLNTTEAALRSVPPTVRGRVASVGIGSRTVPSFDVDNGGGAAAVLRHLYATGRRRIAMVTGPAWLPCAQRPVKAYRDLMRAAGLPVRLVSGDFTAAGGRRAAGTILARWPEVDAVFGINDAAALGVLAALRAAGRQVPEDVAVAGFDDVEAAGLSDPGLTTATNPVEQIISSAVGAVLGETWVPPTTVFPSALVRRASA
ncbi:LacI family DNA-binding transcriptional regulator [Micromonospora sp. HM5-17]|jgi:DNA-binding LacI/PurR family transcriptional regulator|uniref:LacI family DNA-binding transcriptional regulator n=1 Tax=Micromonospora sp. HM5-17 TaxID=2487710 RepID=UPI000F477EFC|nr:LacI family DNA-binding transcriptional regulator [Micromonospora sp. HM5-17]ROT33024.1 LacI family transcriptional regulator [Micromonospora sp. HM5-17]